MSDQIDQSDVEDNEFLQDNADDVIDNLSEGNFNTLPPLGKGLRKKKPRQIFSPQKSVKLKRCKRFTCHLCSRR